MILRNNDNDNGNCNYNDNDNERINRSHVLTKSPKDDHHLVGRDSI